MEIKIIRKEDIKVNNWSGGTTSELFIYPESAKYAERDFDFRLSTATVDVWESGFTPLKGFHRTLMILDGVMILKHETQDELVLKKFNKSVFLGGWKTFSQGKCIDFNLMCSKPFDSEMTGFKVGFDEEKHFQLATNQHYAIYNYKGFSSFKIGGETNEIMQGDCCVIRTDLAEELNITAVTDLEFVFVRIDLES